MTKLNTTDDLAAFADNLTTVTMRRRGSTSELLLEVAYRQPANTSEMIPSGGAAVQADAVWHLQLPDDVAAPAIGDVLIDLQGNRWTILEMQELSSLGRWKCATRELRIASGCHELVDITRPVWGDNGSGPEIVDWVEVCAALPVSIRLDEMILDTSTDSPNQQLIFEIVLSESLSLEPNDRFVAEDGANYQLESLAQSGRIDALPIARAVRVES